MQVKVAWSLANFRLLINPREDKVTQNHNPEKRKTGIFSSARKEVRVGFGQIIGGVIMGIVLTILGQANIYKDGKLQIPWGVNSTPTNQVVVIQPTISPIVVTATNFPPTAVPTSRAASPTRQPTMTLPPLSEQLVVFPTFVLPPVPTKGAIPPTAVAASSLCKYDVRLFQLFLGDYYFAGVVVPGSMIWMYPVNPYVVQIGDYEGAKKSLDIRALKLGQWTVIEYPRDRATFLICSDSTGVYGIVK